MSDRIRADTGTWVNITLSADFVRGLADEQLINYRGEPNRKRLAQVVEMAMLRLEGLDWPVPDGAYSVEPMGVLRLQRGAGEAPRFHFGGNIVPAEAEHEAQRVRDDMMEACRQLQEMPEHPGMIVLDTACDGSLLNRMDEVARVLGESLGHRRLPASLWLSSFSTARLIGLHTLLLVDVATRLVRSSMRSSCAQKGIGTCRRGCIRWGLASSDNCI